MRKTFIIFIYFFLVFIFSFCSSDNENSSGSVIEPPNGVVVPLPPPPTPPDPVVNRQIEENTKKSIFFSLGCCNVEKDQKADCCCEAILKKYKELHSSNKTSLTELNSTDNLLSGCRNMPKWQALFEEIDYPKTDDSEDLLH